MADTGRPTKYKEEYCEDLISHMNKGLSFESFAGVIEVNPDTLYEWCKVHDAFSEAKKIARAKNLIFWELMGIDICKGALEGSASAWVFNMKNRHKWRSEPKVVEVSNMPDIYISEDK